MKMDLHTTQTSTALLCNTNGVDAAETKSLCCAAAGISAFHQAATEALPPQEKLRRAATPNATLTAQQRPPAQLVEGYKHPACKCERPAQLAVNEVQIDERTKFGRETPTPERQLCCAQHDIYGLCYENWESLNAAEAA